jgi:predicted transposase YbfD/YdcC
MVSLGDLRFDDCGSTIHDPCLEDLVVDQFVDMASIRTHFETLDDPRHTRNRKHLLVEVIVICVAGILCGCDGPTAIHRWATERQEWLRQHLTLANGIPSRDCLRRVLIALQPEAFPKCFRTWIAAVIAPVDPEAPPPPKKRLVALDGKTGRGSHDAPKNLGALHLVRAWASEEGIALGQVATEEKSNEITAIPELLQQIELKDTLITIDAMGCQKAIITPIVEGKGDCVIAVKKNQPKLEQAIVESFYEAIESDFEDRKYRHHESDDQGHGRTDERVYYLARVPKDFAVAKDWPEVQAIGYALRYTRHDDGEETVEVRYYISTCYLSGKRFAEAVRGHWAIESMHWVLDVTLREDAHRTRERNLANNLRWLRRFAVSLLKRHPVKDSIKGKMLRCAYNPDFLAEVLQIPAD